MTILIVRTVILYFMALVVIRLMGKRQIGQLQPFEIVITVMISDLAAMPMQDNRIPLAFSAIPMIVLVILQILSSTAQLKSEKARELLSGKPTIIIEHGRIDMDALKEERININDLLEELRLKNFYNIKEIEYAILETSGQLSIIPKTNLTFATKEDLKIPTTQDSLPITLILDGKINTFNLNLINKDLEWLAGQLKRNNVTKPKDVYLAILDSNGDFYCQTK
ncbi:Uncharacterized membrane protein YcaP, DUF421 family [Clostridium collagenovorans DSM 3089]|uniref:Uncharacterized membrane protein YcaP, DUF421 family n=1 Tax=Clostridium collagenovorans DSM 3089 TaxID=1121306 RepID=A0A1M5XXX7_9CLOT|nr:DUF421 domain-containing protein [Clostridium collagenovorans]SHI04675.1 Uncharacterized membrane protein YcaP, DUF421 family [Clostridium collagenovorans DSM 3089]